MTDPTPERRWRINAHGLLQTPEGTPAYLYLAHRAHRILDTLNEAETLRERVQVLESLVDRIEAIQPRLRLRNPATPEEIREFGEIKAVLRARALAGAETEEAGR